MTEVDQKLGILSASLGWNQHLKGERATDLLKRFMEKLGECDIQWDENRREFSVILGRMEVKVWFDGGQVWMRQVTPQPKVAKGVPIEFNGTDWVGSELDRDKGLAPGQSYPRRDPLEVMVDTLVAIHEEN